MGGERDPEIRQIKQLRTKIDPKYHKENVEEVIYRIQLIIPKIKS